MNERLDTYSDAVRIPSITDQVLLSGTPGLRPDGSSRRGQRRGPTGMGERPCGSG